MTPAHEARAHAAKAREFLAAAQMSLDRGQRNAACSSAVLAGIHSKDAVCLTLTGRTDKGESHDAAVRQLREAGGGSGELANALRRLLRLKPKAQYDGSSVSAADAARAVLWAERLVLGAIRIVGD